MNVTKKLNWHIHICSLCAILSKVYYIINVMNFHMIENIYYAYFQSQMKHGIIFWGKDGNTVIFFCIQKKVIQLIFGLNTCNFCKHIFMDYRILTVASLYILELLCFIKKFQREFKT